MELSVETMSDLELADKKELLLKDLNEAEFLIHQIGREQERRALDVPDEG